MTEVNNTVTLTCVHEGRHGCDRTLEIDGWVTGEWFTNAREAGWFPIFMTEALCPEHFRTDILED